MITLPQPVRYILNHIKSAGFEVYIVGGAVRDALLKKAHIKDWDFTTNATPAQIMSLFKNSFYDNHFGTVMIAPKHLAEQMNISIPEENFAVFDITTFRTEHGYSDKRRPDKVIWGNSLEEDLARRDFTINALAFDGQKIIDPYHGLTDLHNRLVKAVDDPTKRFSEDALRMMRAIRVATELTFIIEPNTFQAIQKSARNINYISADRIRHELMRILASDFPGDGVMLLRNSNLLSEILPELEKAFGVPQKSPQRHHIYDVGTHLVKSLNHCPSPDPLVRLATLLHDVGKPQTFSKDPQTQVITFYNHEVVGAKIVRQIANRLNFSNHDKHRLITLVRWHQFTVDERQTDKALRRFIRRVGKENLQDMIDLRIGDRLGGGARETSWRLRLFMKRLEEVQKQPFTVTDLQVDGHDVMDILKLAPGPKIGEILTDLFNQVVEGKLKNDRDELLKQLQK